MTAATQASENDGYDACIRLIRFLLNANGIYPLTYEKHRYLKRTYTSFILAWILSVVVFPQISKIYVVRHELEKVLRILSTAVTMTFICAVKATAIWAKSDGLKDLLESASEDWRVASEQDQVIMWKNGKISRLVAVALASSTLANCTLLLSVHVITYYAFGGKALHESGNFTRLFFLDSDFYGGAAAQTSPAYEIFFSMQFLGCILCCFIYAAYDGLFAFVTLHYSGQFYNLQRRFENAVEEATGRRCEFVEVFAPMVRRHQYLCRSSIVIEESFNKLFLFKITALSVILCLQAYQIVLDISRQGVEKLPNVVFSCFNTLTSFLTIFVYCYIAEQTRTESANLFTAVYKMNWYKLSPRDAKLILLVMARARDPTVITLGKFAELSLEYFCQVVKTSGGYFSVLLAMREKLAA